MGKSASALDGASALSQPLSGTCKFIKPALRWQVKSRLKYSVAGASEPFGAASGRWHLSRFLCIRIPHFPAWAAQRADASLADKPVLVYDRGRVLAASPSALERGVEIGCTLHRAEAMWPDCLACPHHVPTTMVVWEDVLESLYGLTPCLESIYPGQLMAEVRPPSAVKPLLERWGAHGGVADDRIAAELAAVTAQAGKLRTVTAGKTIEFLHCLPITVLNEIGVHPDAIERLGWFGWTTIAHLRPLARRQMLAQFEQGALLYRYAQADDTRPVPPFREPPVIEVTYEFEDSAHEPWEIEPVLDWLERQAREQLDQRFACSVTVTLLTKAGTLRSSRLLREPTAQVYPLRQAAYGCLQELLSGQAGAAGSRIPSRLAVIRATLRLSQLRSAPGIQAELFEPVRPPVQKALRALERRFPGTMRRIVTLDSDAYLPEEAFRLDPIEAEAEAVDGQKTGRKKAAPKILATKGAVLRPVPRFARPASRSKSKRRTASQAGIPRAALLVSAAPASEVPA